MLTVEQLSSNQTKMVEERMRPGFLTATQSLKALAKNDNETLIKHGITYTQIADRLDSIMEKTITLMNHRKSEKSLSGKTLCVEGKYIVKCMGYLGHQSCPLSLEADMDRNDCGKSKGSMDFCATRIDTQAKFTFGSLLPHLIRDHHFFEGGTYRVDPETAINFFELKPDASYMSKMIKKSTWDGLKEGSFMTDIICSHDLSYVEANKTHHLIVEEGIEAFVIKGSSPRPPRTCTLLTHLKAGKQYVYIICRKEYYKRTTFEINNIHFNDIISKGSMVKSTFDVMEACLDPEDGFIDDSEKTAQPIEESIFKTSST
jgi:hypothetical protein